MFETELLIPNTASLTCLPNPVKDIHSWSCSSQKHGINPSTSTPSHNSVDKIGSILKMYLESHHFSLPPTTTTLIKTSNSHIHYGFLTFLFFFFTSFLGFFFLFLSGMPRDMNSYFPQVLFTRFTFSNYFDLEENSDPTFNPSWYTIIPSPIKFLNFYYVFLYFPIAYAG